jgi:hypothetical protein
MVLAKLQGKYLESICEKCYYTSRHTVHSAIAQCRCTVHSQLRRFVPKRIVTFFFAVNVIMLAYASYDCTVRLILKSCESLLLTL